MIEPEGRWTQGVARRGKSGRYVKDPRRAVCWCVMGALDHVVGENPFDGVRSRAGVKLTVFLGESYVTFNDAPGRTQAEVVDALRKAAEHAEVSNG